jgi:ribosomal protein S18 acetylase RimI-like enzyme
MTDVTIIQADLDDAAHQDAVLAMVNAYARDPMGRGEELPVAVQAGLIEGLRAHPTSLIFLAFQGERPVGIAVCFVGFSTFAAKPLINIHDLSVVPEMRSAGVGRRLLERVETAARMRGCCKITLEVLAENLRAQRLYQSVGFRNIPPGGGASKMWFLEKPL